MSVTLPWMSAKRPLNSSPVSCDIVWKLRDVACCLEAVLSSKYLSAQPKEASKSWLSFLIISSMIFSSVWVIIPSSQNSSSLSRMTCIGSFISAFMASITICLIMFFTKSLADFALSSPCAQASAYASAKSLIAAWMSEPNIASCAFAALSSIRFVISSYCFSHSLMRFLSGSFLLFSSCIWRWINNFCCSSNLFWSSINSFASVEYAFSIERDSLS